jgi:hypothetical protein
MSGDKIDFEIIKKTENIYKDITCIYYHNK